MLSAAIHPKTQRVPADLTPASRFSLQSYLVCLDTSSLPQKKPKHLSLLWLRTNCNCLQNYSSGQAQRKVRDLFVQLQDQIVISLSTGWCLERGWSSSPSRNQPWRNAIQDAIIVFPPYLFKWKIASAGVQQWHPIIQGRTSLGAFIAHVWKGHSLCACVCVCVSDCVCYCFRKRLCKSPRWTIFCL